MDDFNELFVAYQDYGAPMLDVYEQAIYLYILRHTILSGVDNAVIGFKSARKKMAFGIGKAGTPPSEAVVYEKLRGLEQKSFVKVLTSERTGTRIQILTPYLTATQSESESEATCAPLSIEEVDFFEVPQHRSAILQREANQCFYCMSGLTEANYVIEHVVSRPAGSNSYRNLVAACRQCNNRKDASPADEFLRRIYREGILTQQELTVQLGRLQQLALGELKPIWPLKAQA